MAEFYSARGWEIPPLPWTNLSPPFSVAILKKRLHIDASLYTMTQVLSLTLFKKTSLVQLLRQIKTTGDNHPEANQLNLFND